MHTLSKGLLGFVVLVAILGIGILVMFHLGGVVALRAGQLAPLLGAFLGGGLVLFNVALPTAHTSARDWKGRERISWVFMGMGIVAWGIGEAIWRSSVSPGPSAFPSFANGGYALFPLLAFVSLLLKPSFDAKSQRFAFLMESFIFMGTFWSIAWYYFLGKLAQTTTGMMSLDKVLILYYPASDIILLSYSLFLLLHGSEERDRSLIWRVRQLVAGVGLSVFVVADFLFHLQQQAGTAVESPWIDLGRFLGLIAIGIAASVGRFPRERGERQQRRPDEDQRNHLLNPLRGIFYGSLVWLFVVAIQNIVASDSLQQAIRPVLLLSALTVFGLVMVRQLVVIERQIVTIREHMRVAQEQTKALEYLAQTKRHIEDQSQQIAEQKTELERGIEHLRNVQASLANGDFHARATLTHGTLWPLAANLNLMADRLARTLQDAQYAQHLVKTLGELSDAIDQGMPFDIPESCYDFPEMSQLVAALRVQEISSVTSGRMPAMPSVPVNRATDGWLGRERS